MHRRPASFASRNLSEHTSLPPGRFASCPWKWKRNAPFSRLGIVWREWMTRRLAGRFLSDERRARLLARTDIDNPDQRITEDVRTFTATSLSFFLIFLNSSVTLVAFCGVLWSIAPSLFVAAAI